MKNFLEKGKDLFTKSNYPYYQKTSVHGEKISNTDLNDLLGSYLPSISSSMHPNIRINEYKTNEETKKITSAISSLKERIATEEAVQVELIKNLKELLFGYDLYETKDGKDATSEKTNNKDYKRNRDYIKNELSTINFKEGTIGAIFYQLLNGETSSLKLQELMNKLTTEKKFETIKGCIENANNNIANTFLTGNSFDNINLN